MMELRDLQLAWLNSVAALVILEYGQKGGTGRIMIGDVVKWRYTNNC
ncbi:MAG: hypothetical protein H6613_06665 [Ignavibacteriales bacterium]|nr:hypothetical protein [Ignavibacteriales bacterium]